VIFTILIATLFFSDLSLANDTMSSVDFAAMTQSTEKLFKKLDIKNVSTKDLCTKKSLPLPAKIKTLKLWASWCPPCIQSLKETWDKDPETLWVNVDSKADGVKKACDILTSHKIKIVAYYDSESSIKSQVGQPFPIPAKLTFEGNNVAHVVIGSYYDPKKLNKTSK
jgi:thiol-disulfide isomerase/thioredoxin